MKFRAITRRYEAINAINRSILAAAKLTEFLVFRIDSDTINLIPDTSSPTNHVSIRFVWNRTLLFDDYSFKGLNNDHNVIYFYLYSNSIIDIINAIHTNVQFLKIKLTTNNQQKPILQFTSEKICRAESEQQTIKNQVLVVIINQQSWSLYDEYTMNSKDISLNLPSFNQFAFDVAKLVNCSPFIRISAKYYYDDDENMTKAKLSMTGFVDSLQLGCRYEKLPITNESSMIDDDRRSLRNQSPQTNKIYVDIRKLNQFISAITMLQPTDGICEIEKNHTILFKFFAHFINFKIILTHFDIE
nr:uncharacterized protein LOC124498045 [Dermatophagoides farinae]